MSGDIYAVDKVLLEVIDKLDPANKRNYIKT
jgi:hypothetical protein